MLPSRTQILQAIADKTWDVGNDVLYDLCQTNPRHTLPDVVIAKVWLIGRSYAAAIERRKLTSAHKGDDFYKYVVAPQIIGSPIDTWIDEVGHDPVERLDTVIQVHCRLTKLFRDISGSDKRSLASKYLHFHLPSRYYIFDSRASRAVGYITKDMAVSAETWSNADPQYAKFVRRCERLRTELSQILGRPITPRELDKVALAWHGGSAQGE